MNRKPIPRCLFLFKVTILLVVSANVSAQRMMPFEELSREMQGHLLPFTAIERDPKFIDCSTIPIDLIETRHGERNSQWIYNGLYSWGFATMDDGLCVYLKHPIHRGLTREEARVLLSASRREFPIAPEPQGEIDPKDLPRPTTRSLNLPALIIDPRDNSIRPVPEPPTEYLDPKDLPQPTTRSPNETPIICPGGHVRPVREPGNKQECSIQPCDHGICNDGKSGEPVPDLAPDTRIPLADFGYPYYSLAMIQNTTADGTATASAVQLSPYVFATAAHVIVDVQTGTRYPRATVFPHYKVPSVTAGIPIADSVYDPEYRLLPLDTPTFTNTHRYAHDIAFVRIDRPSTLVAYPRMFFVDSRNDCFNAGYAYVGSLFCDPWYINIRGASDIPSWYPGPVGDADVSSIGYPDFVLGIDNRLANNPYYDYSGGLQGFPDGYELFHPCSPDCLAVTGAQTFVTQGNSGGPIFGFDHNDPAHEIKLLGIVTHKVPNNPDPTLASSPYALAAGDFDYNDFFYQSNVGWTPGFPINISMPVEGATYDNISLPDFTATASSYTADLQWSSDIDGALGSGGMISVDGLLTEGPQTIRATMGTPPGVTDAATIPTPDTVPYGVQTRHITITAAPSTFTATPNPAPVRHGESLAYTTLNWNAPAYTGVDIGLMLNGTESTVTSGGSSGSTSVAITLGNSYTFKLLRHGVVLRSAEVTAELAPWVEASLNPVVIPPGRSIGTTTVSWDGQPSHPRIDLYVSVDDAPQTIVTSANQTFSVDVPWITMGHQFRFLIYPTGATMNPLSSVIVMGISDGIFASNFDSA